MNGPELAAIGKFFIGGKYYQIEIRKKDGIVSVFPSPLPEKEENDPVQRALVLACHLVTENLEGFRRREQTGEGDVSTIRRLMKFQEDYQRKMPYSAALELQGIIDGSNSMVDQSEALISRHSTVLEGLIKLVLEIESDKYHEIDPRDIAESLRALIK